MSPQLVRGGQVGGLLAEESEELKQKIQELAANMEEDDFNFYSNAAYQNAIRQFQGSAADVRGQLAFEGTKQEQEREMKFAWIQSGLNRQFQTEIYKRSAERAHRAQATRLQFQRGREEEAEERETYHDIGRTVSQVGTLVALNKLG